MTKAHLVKLWTWISVACFAYVVGSVISIQGGIDVFGAKLFVDKNKDGIEVLAYVAVFVGSALLCAALAIMLLFAKRHGRAWHERIPVVLLDGLNTASLEGRLFQLAVVFVLVTMPLYGIGRSMIVANRGVVCEQTEKNEAAIHYQGGDWRLINLPAASNQLRLMRSETPPGTCGGSGVEIGWYTPIVFAVLPGTCLLMFLAWIGFLLWPPRTTDNEKGSTGDRIS